MNWKNSCHCRFDNLDPEGGELSEIFCQRIKSFYDDIMEKRPGQTVLLLTHFGVINIF